MRPEQLNLFDAPPRSSAGGGEIAAFPLDRHASIAAAGRAFADTPEAELPDAVASWLDAIFAARVAQGLDPATVDNEMMAVAMAAADARAGELRNRKAFRSAQIIKLSDARKKAGAYPPHPPAPAAHTGGEGDAPRRRRPSKTREASR